MKTVTLLALFIVLILITPIVHKDSTAKTVIETKRDQELFLAGAKTVAERHFDEGRILLNTMIETYSESPLREQAQLIVFYSYAREGGAKHEKATKLFKAIEEQMKAYEPKQRMQ